MKKLIVAALFVLVALLVFGSAHAELVTYNYVGTYFFPTSTDRVTGTLTFDNSITSDVIANFEAVGGYGFPTSHIVALTLTSAFTGTLTYNPPTCYFYTGYTPMIGWKDGQIIAWDFRLIRSEGNLTLSIYSMGSYLGGQDFAERTVVGVSSAHHFTLDPGTWTQASSAVPLPSGILLLAPGLAGLAVLRRRFRR